MKIAGYIYFSIFIFAYIFIGAYGAMWSKYNKERASKLYILHGLSAALLMILLWIGLLIFKGDGTGNVIFTFKLIYIYVAVDLLISIYTWYKLNPFFKAILNEYGDIITYKKPCDDLTKFQRVLYGCYKPAFNILLLIWQGMFCYFSLSLFISFVISTI